MKKSLCNLIITLVTSNISIAQTNRYERSYNVIGLSDADEVLESLIIAIPLLLLGFIIAYIFMWSKTAQKSNDNKRANIGCVGFIIMVIGAVFLFPLLTWIEYIGMTIFGIALIIVIVFAILYFISSLFRKK